MPQAWKSTTWGGLATLEYGKGLVGYENANGDYPVYGTNGMIGWHSEPLFEKAGVIIGRKGAYRGVHYSKTPFFVIDTAFYLKPKTEFDLRWAYYQLLTHDINSMDSGSAIPSTSRPDFYALPVLLPPLPEQHAIAGILGALDDKIELNRRINNTLEEVVRAVFREWFMGSKNAASWDKCTLGQLFGENSDCVLTGPFGSHLHARDYRAEGTPLILVKHVMNGHILEDGLPLVGEHKLPDMTRYMLEVGDIVFTRVGAVGRSAYIHPRNKGWLISGQTLRVRVPDRSKLNPRYLAQVYLEPSFGRMVEQHALGTTRPSLNTDILLSFEFALPPTELQNKFGELAQSMDRKVQHNLDESRTLAALRDTLLPKLISGEVRVTE